MKIYTSEQVRKADAFTIKNEPISSVDLMERAATGAFNWIVKRFNKKVVFSIFCGVGNNGGDGLVLARLLHKSGYRVNVYEVRFSEKQSEDYAINKQRLVDASIPLLALKSIKDVVNVRYGNVIIDAIFGSGLSREVNGWVGELILDLNDQGASRISIDIASGLFAENNDKNNGVVFTPDFTLAFEFPKLAFLFPGNARFVGHFVIIPIGISKGFILNEPTNYFTIEKFAAKIIRKKGNKFDYKSTYGHTLIMAGSYGKMGAAVLATKSALKSGSGLVTTHIPKCGYDIMQISVPEAMTWTDKHLGYLTEQKKISNFSAIGIGPGIGQKSETVSLVANLFKSYNKPLVVDADALNIISEHRSLLDSMPVNSILTPHLGEWKRLNGDSIGDFNILESAISFARKYHVIVVLKGAHTAIICPDSEVFFNTTGNPGMATAGSGDVLMGVLTGLLAQGYIPKQAAILGVYIHGLAGDLALKKGSRESVVASDIIAKLGKAFSKIEFKH